MMKRITQKKNEGIYPSPLSRQKMRLFKVDYFSSLSGVCSL
jgi:hypothetical protein